MKRIFASILLIVLLAPAGLAHAAPKKNLWPRWQINNPLSKKAINYKLWANFLKQYVHTNSKGINLVAYGDVSEVQKRALRNFLKYMASIHIDSYNRKAQEAYWINLYNALTVDVVLRHYPVKSIMNIKISGLFSPGLWGAKLIKVEGIPLSLNDLEHRILRPIWNDQRIHYAVNCASISCPNLQKTPFTPRNLESQLNTATRAYINSNRGTELKGDKLVVSSIYIWYKADFGGTDDDVIDWLELYATPVLRNRLKFIKKISSNRYDWKLNLWTAEQKPQKKRRYRRRRR